MNPQPSTLNPQPAPCVHSWFWRAEVKNFVCAHCHLPLAGAERYALEVLRYIRRERPTEPSPGEFAVPFDLAAGIAREVHRQYERFVVEKVKARARWDAPEAGKENAA